MRKRSDCIVVNCSHACDCVEDVMTIWTVGDRYYLMMEEAVAECNALNELGYPVVIEQMDVTAEDFVFEPRSAEPPP